MRSPAVIVLLSGLLVSAHASQTEADQNELERLEGTWIVVAQEANGLEITEDELTTKGVKGFDVVWTVKGNKITHRPNTDFQLESTFELDSTKTPNEITITHLHGPNKGTSKRGIYSLGQDVLRVCVNIETDKIPTHFTTRPGDGLRILSLKRQMP
jgi:uncharacterized protein (TIGR03067 family)